MPSDGSPSVTPTNLAPRLSPPPGASSESFERVACGLCGIWSDLLSAVATTATALVEQPGPGESGPEETAVLDGTAHLVADDGTHGEELWRSDDTAAGAYLVADIAPGADSSLPCEPQVGGRIVSFSAPVCGLGLRCK